MAVKTTNFTEENQIINDGNDINTQEEVQITPVRYKGGETAKDIEDNTFTEPNNFVQNLLNKGKNVAVKSTKPLTAKENEPEYGYEWAEEAATRVWDSGKSLDEIEKEMNKKYPLAAARIKDATENSYEYEKKNRTPPYHSPIEMDDGEGGKYTSYLSPKTQAEIEIANRYGFMIDEEKPESTLVVYKPSEAAKFINTNKELKKEWQAFNDGKFNSKELINRYNRIKSALVDMAGAQDLKTLKKLGFSSQSDYDLMVGYLAKSLDARLAKYAKDAGLIKQENATEKTEEVKTETPKPVDVAKHIAKEVTTSAIEGIKNDSKEVIDDLKEKTEEAKAEEEISPETKEEVEMIPASLEEDQVLAEAEKAALETEKLVNAD